MQLFFFGTLRHTPLLNLVLGRPIDVVPAALPGWCVRRAEGGDFPILAVDETAAAQGILTPPLSALDVERLRYYEGGFGYDLAERDVETAQGPQRAFVFVAPDVQPSDKAWRYEAWAAQWADMTMIAAAEIMRGFGVIPSAEMSKRFPIIRARAWAATRSRNYDRGMTVGAGLSAEDITSVDNSMLYESFLTLSDLTMTHSKLDRSGLVEVKRTVVEVPDAVTVLPYDPLRDRVLLVEQIRTGAVMRNDPQPWMLEPVAGLVDAGDTDIDTAVREAWEEAKLRVEQENFHWVGRYYPSPGGVAQIITSYIAVVDLPDSLIALDGGKSDEGEDIASHLVSFDVLMGLLDSGEAANAPLILSAQWLALNRQRLRAVT